VKKIVAIEGIGPAPARLAEYRARTIVDRMDDWIKEQRMLSARMPRRYASVEDAFRRMQEENQHLTAGQARHLTEHGVNQNEDGSFSWKFDNYVRAFPPYDMPARDIVMLWGRIACPTLLLWGKESRWASDPMEDGRAAHFKHARVVGVDRAGHWLHHDRLDEFLRILREFFAEKP
jgi:pimeloyl-ACP methyl ester carboxylesterase